MVCPYSGDYDFCRGCSHSVPHEGTRGCSRAVPDPCGEPCPICRPKEDEIEDKKQKEMYDKM